MAFEMAPPKAPRRIDSRAPAGTDAPAPTARRLLPTRVFVVDESGIMRDGLCALLAGHDAFEVVGTGSSSSDVARCAGATPPHVVVVDFPRTRPGSTTLVANIKARLPGVRVLVLTFQNDEQFVDAALRAGADGYVLKNDSCRELFTALRAVASGKRFISTSINERVAPARNTADQTGRSPASSPLTERERQVMGLIAAGRRTREIAQILSLSHKTIEKHRTSLMRKLGLRNASAVAAYATSHGLGDA